MNEQDLLARIELLEYHQRLLLKILNNPNLELYKLIVEKGLSEQEIKKFFSLCNELSIKMEEQKAEGFVYFHPLFNKFLSSMQLKVDVEEVIHACMAQQLFEPLFQEFIKYI